MAAESTRGAFISHPARVIVSAPSCAGKTSLIVRFLMNDVFRPSPDRVVICYQWPQKTYNELTKKFGSRLQFVQGFSSDLVKPDYFNPDVNNFLIIDDVLGGLNADMLRLFTELSHHRNCTCVFLLQSIFPKERHAKTLATNATHRILLNNPSDAYQVMRFAQQLFPRHYKMFMEHYTDIMSTPYGYIVCSLAPNCPKELRLSTNLCGESDVPFPVYLPLEGVTHTQFVVDDENHTIHYDS